MPTAQRMESPGGRATAEDRAALIFIADFSPIAGTGEQLASQLRAMTNPIVAIHHEAFHDSCINEASDRLSAVVLRSRPDLLLLLLSDTAQALAPTIFRALLGRKHGPPIVVVPSSDDPHVISELYQLGANDYLLPPFRSADVHPRVERLLAYGSRQGTAVAVLKEALGLQQFVGESPALMEQIQKIPRIARCNASVLITGETGTGKEVCSRVIHYLSPRADQPFIPLNCGAIPVELLENELFGHGAGAFTSASVSQLGVIHEGNGGTLFLDEIDSLPLSSQVKLLRFLQDKEFRPLGARKASKADVRIIAATNADIEELVAAGKMRRDLYYRLNVLKLDLPPLRQRKEDIPILARYFLSKYAQEFGSKACDIAPAALRKLSLHGWPGNVRELENVIERAVVLSTGGTIQGEEVDLPIVASLESESESFGLLKAKVVTDFERNYLRTLLERHRGNIAQAAKAAGKNRRAFFQLMRKHQIHVEHSPVDSDTKRVDKVVIVMDKNVRPANRLQR